MYDFYKHYLERCRIDGQEELEEIGISPPSLKKIFSHANQYDYAVVSAMEDDLFNEENKDRTEKLIKALLLLGYSCTKLVAHHQEDQKNQTDLKDQADETDETDESIQAVSLLVINQPTPLYQEVDPAELFFHNIMMLGNRFNQETVLLKRVENPNTYEVNVTKFTVVEPEGLPIEDTTGMPVGAINLGEISSAQELLAKCFSKTEGKVVIFNEPVEHYVLPYIRGRLTHSPAIRALKEEREDMLEWLTKQIGEEKAIEHYNRYYEPSYKQRCEEFTRLYKGKLYKGDRY